MQIPDNRLDRLFQAHQEEYEEAALRALRSGWYVLGREGAAFEGEFAAFCGSRYCVGLNSGLDALVLAIRALDIGAGDEVIVPSNTYIATVLAVTENGATPVFVEPDVYYNMDAKKIEAAITDKTKAILPVHLYGQAANMGPMVKIAREYGLYLLEDCAQSHSACFEGKMTGTFGDIGCFSFFPTKNLGAFGDAGAIVTDNGELADKVRKLRNYGSAKKYHNELQGVNSRLDEIQAALLRVRLPHLPEIVAERQRIAAAYLAEIKNPLVQLPGQRRGAEHIWHLFVVESAERDALQAHLAAADIHTQIHYPIPPHLAACYSELGYHKGDFPIAEKIAESVLSLPLYNGMTDAEVDYVVTAVNAFGS